MHLVSIITIVKNGREHIARAFASMANQTYPYIEYIVIDGGSTDGTISIIEDWDHIISRWTSEPDKGIGDAFNKGIAMSTGSIIGILNSDDWFEENTIEKVIAHWRNCELLYGKVRYWKDERAINEKWGNHKTLLNGFLGMTVPHSSLFVDKSVYDELGGYPLNYKVSMDYHFVLRAALAEKRFKRIPDVLANFRLGGISSRFRAQLAKDERDIKLELLKLPALVIFIQYVLKMAWLKIMGDIAHILPLNRFK